MFAFCLTVLVSNVSGCRHRDGGTVRRWSSRGHPVHPHSPQDNAVRAQQRRDDAEVRLPVRQLRSGGVVLGNRGAHPQAAADIGRGVDGRGLAAAGAAQFACVSLERVCGCGARVARCRVVRLCGRCRWHVIVGSLCMRLRCASVRILARLTVPSPIVSVVLSIQTSSRHWDGCR